MQAVVVCLLSPLPSISSFFFFNDTATTEIYTLSLHDALPIYAMFSYVQDFNGDGWPDVLVLGRVHLHEAFWYENPRSEEHTSELQSQSNLVCRLLLEKKKQERQEMHR